MREQAVPTHVGLILDGNRRWARARALPIRKGHQKGLEQLRTNALHAFDRGVKYLSAYVFSTENWSRAEEEVSYLMKLVIKFLEQYIDEIHERGVKVIVVGRKDGIRQDVLRAITNAEAKTRDNANGTMAFCFNYGGHDEIVDVVKRLAEQGLKPEQITRETVAQALYAPEVPGVDLIIRTSGEHRTSGFMLYRSDYAELYFADKNWPDFTPADMDDALADYAQRKRRFGK